EESVFIADIGNNQGSRENLKIYKVNRDQLLSGGSAASQTIHISYASQTDFTPANHFTPYDAEALTSIGDSLYLFSKDWTTFSTTVYSIPKVSGTYSLNALAQYQVNALITGADYNPVSHQLALCGYSFTGVYLFRTQIESPADFTSPVFLIDTLYVSASAQVEGITYAGVGNNLYLSAEFDQTGAAALYHFDAPSAGFISHAQGKLTISPNPCSGRIYLHNSVNINQNERLNLITSDGKTFELKILTEQGKVYADLPASAEGVCTITYSQNGKLLNARLLVIR
ncbi:MAG: hypothetical protein KDC13_07885, partial [Bacteroidetes bacterium]|nr:hypothetical protein [Bacteroidota bacterium]